MAHRTGTKDLEVRDTDISPKNNETRGGEEHERTDPHVAGIKSYDCIIQQRNAACGLSDESFGFRAGRGIDAPVLLVKKAIRDAVRKGEQRFLLFIDLHKAYDYLDRDRTWVFLRKYGMDEHTVRILQSLYEDELLLDVVDGDCTVINPARGLRQGCSLSPMIFNIAMDAAFRTAKKEMEGIYMGL